jgi:protein-S-isoprenylcysteine O-methyltransferase Ste14
MALIEEFEKQGIWLFKYRSYLPLIILFFGTILYLRVEIYPGTFFLEETPYEVYYELFCLGISLFGLAIRIFTVGYTPKNTSGRNTKEQLADKLNTTGIYSIVRHPLYLGNFFMWLGLAALAGNIWFILIFCFVYWVYYERIMFAEEQFLRKKFGEQYLNWANSVPPFIPKFSNYIKSTLRFSWKKVFKQEKNGLAATFLIFCLLDISGEMIENHKKFNYFFIYGSILSLSMYVVLKYLKIKTNILSETDR